MIGGIHPGADIACRRGDRGRGPFLSILPIRTFGPLLVGVERAGGVGSRTHLDIIVRRAAGHRRQVVMVVWVIDRLRVGWVVRRVAYGMAIGLWITGVRVDFVASKDDGTLMRNENAPKKHGEVKTNRKG